LKVVLFSLVGIQFAWVKYGTTLPGFAFGKRQRGLEMALQLQNTLLGNAQSRLNASCPSVSSTTVEFSAKINTLLQKKTVGLRQWATEEPAPLKMRRR
jgi:hypothetical protein